MSSLVEQKFAPDRERERLNRRIATISGTPAARDLSAYRRGINKLDAIKDRGVRAFPYSTPRGYRYRAADEIKLCHQFLDEHSIASMYL